MSVSDFLPDFADVDVDRTVADNHRIAPDTGVDLFPGEEFSGRGGEQGEQGELLAGQFDTFSVADYQMSMTSEAGLSAATRLRIAWMRLIRSLGLIGLEI